MPLLFNNKEDKEKRSTNWPLRYSTNHTCQLDLACKKKSIKLASFICAKRLPLKCQRQSRWDLISKLHDAAIWGFSIHYDTNKPKGKPAAPYLHSKLSSQIIAEHRKRNNIKHTAKTNIKKGIILTSETFQGKKGS